MPDLTPPWPTERSVMETPIYDRLVRERGIDPVMPHYRMRVVLGTDSWTRVRYVRAPVMIDHWRPDDD